MGEFGGGWFTADRADLPFVTEVEPGTANEIGGKRRLGLGKNGYPDRNWTAKWKAWQVLQEFAVFNWQGPAQAVIDPIWTPIDDASTKLEIDELVRAARDERAEALGNILAQDVEFISEYMSVLTITPASHPKTYRVLHVASLIGSYVALYFKFQKQRPRPSHICPALHPPIPVPGHSAFPSGHSTQAHLIRLCIKRVMDLARADYAAVPLPNLPQADIDTFTVDLLVLANRVARNREIAGLHFQTDSQAGAVLAESALASMIALGNASAFNAAIQDAKGEW